VLLFIEIPLSPLATVAGCRHWEELSLHQRLAKRLRAEMGFSGLPIEGQIIQSLQLAQKIDSSIISIKSFAGHPPLELYGFDNESCLSLDVNTISWSDDPRNALNWGMWKKVYNSSVPALLSFLM
jgi:hypothetical protein